MKARLFFYETIGFEAISNGKYPLKDPDWVHDADVARFNFFKKRGLSDSGETCPNEVPQSKYYFHKPFFSSSMLNYSKLPVKTNSIILTLSYRN